MSYVSTVVSTTKIRALSTQIISPLTCKGLKLQIKTTTLLIEKTQIRFTPTISKNEFGVLFHFMITNQPLEPKGRDNSSPGPLTFICHGQKQ